MGTPVTESDRFVVEEEDDDNSPDVDSGCWASCCGCGGVVWLLFIVT